MNKLYMLKNNKGEVKNYSKLDTKEFQRLNLEWWNVYESVNTFFLEWRKEKDLEKFNAIWIDLDVWIENKFPSFKELLAYIIQKIGVIPSKINETYKGYHIFFEFSKELEYLTLDSYKDLYNFINSNLWGDSNMRDVTGILKVEWFLDNKEWRAYEIKNIYNNPANKLNKDYLLTYWIKAEFRKEELVIKKGKQKLRNKQDIENLDGKSFIEGINELVDSNHYLFRKRIELIEQGEWLYGIDSTDGLKLKLNKDTDKWEICDYSIRKRSWIYPFLYNYYFKDESTDIKNKGKTVILKKFGINSQMGWDKVSENAVVSFWFQNKEYIRDNQILKSEGYKELLEIDELIKKMNLDNIRTNSLSLLFDGFSFLSVKQNQPLHSQNGLLISENELLELFWYSINTGNKKKMRELALELSTLKFTEKKTKIIYGKELTLSEVKYIFSLWFATAADEKWKIYYNIKCNINTPWILYIPQGILQLKGGLFENKRALAAKELYLGIAKFKAVTFSKQKFVELLKIVSKDDNQINRNIREFLQECKELNLITNYSKDWNSFKIW